MATYNSDKAQDQLNAESNAAKMKTGRSELMQARGLVTFPGTTVQNDIFLIEKLRKGADIDWLSAEISSLAAAVVGQIGVVNAAGVFTAKATLTSATNVGKASAPSQVTDSITTEPLWIAYKVTAASPPTSGTADIRVNYLTLSS